MMYSPNQLSQLVNQHVESLRFARKPFGLYDPITYVLSPGGKRIRPVLMLMAYNLYRTDVEAILDPATAIEVYHNYTLLHDDLMDRADMRRATRPGTIIPPFSRAMPCWCWLTSIWPKSSLNA